MVLTDFRSVLSLRILRISASLLILSSVTNTLGAADDAPKSASTETTSNANSASIDLSDSISFIGRYCLDCHGNSEPSADRNFDPLSLTISNDSDLIDYQEIVDQLNLGRMPPADSEQPSREEVRKNVKLISSKLNEYYTANQGSGGRTPLRRLNAREYRNTVRDLFDLKMLMFDPTVKFPADQTFEKFDNHADTLVTSGHLLTRYLDAAEQVIKKAAGPVRQPVRRTWSFTDQFNQQPEIDQVHKKTNGFTHLSLYDVINADKHEGAYAPLHQFEAGVPIDGYYDIRFEAEAVNRTHPYDPDFLGIDPSVPLRLGIVAGHRDAGTLHLPQPIEPLLGEVELEDRAKWYTVRVWLDAGFTPRFTFQNGLMDARNLWSRLIRKYPDQFPPGSNQGIVKARYNAIHLGKLPHIRIYEVEIEGPFLKQWPLRSQQIIFGPDNDNAQNAGNPAMVQDWTDQQRRSQVTNFLSRAYRRPSTDGEVDRIIQIVNQRMAKGRTHREAYLDGLQAALCSPNFLYIDSSTTGHKTETLLSSYGLASRLSYFLWASMPDDRLLDLASTGQLNRQEVLQAEVLRMLDDPKADALISGFLDSWLGLRELGSTPPDRGRFQDYYHHDLDKAMRRETFLYAKYLMTENLPTALFLDSNFTFANRSLARHYGIRAISGYEFQRVTFDDPIRGGLLGQASILTLTANGIDTSPIVRGVWILEHLLGTPPSPPPPDVEPLDPDIRGAKTIRQQMERHRSNPACFDCHQEIDPLGFALENFDPVGEFRTHYPRGPRIDPTGELPDGSQFKDVADLKEELLRHKDLFHTAIAKSLFTYAMGRQPEPIDRPQLDAIIEKAGPEIRFRDLITATVLSESFRRP